MDVKSGLASLPPISCFNPASILVSVLQIILKLGKSCSINLKEGKMGVLLPPLQLPRWSLTPKASQHRQFQQECSELKGLLSSATEICRNSKSKATGNSESAREYLSNSSRSFKPLPEQVLSPCHEKMRQFYLQAQTATGSFHQQGSGSCQGQRSLTFI